MGARRCLALSPPPLYTILRLANSLLHRISTPFVSTLRLTRGSVPLIGCRAEDLLGSSATIPPATLFYTSLLAVPLLSDSLRDLTTLPPVITAAGVAPYRFCCCLPSFLLLSAAVLVVLAPVCGRRAPHHQPFSKFVPCSRLGR